MSIPPLPIPPGRSIGTIKRSDRPDAYGHGPDPLYPPCRFKPYDRVVMKPGRESFCGKLGKALSVHPRWEPLRTDKEFIRATQNGWLVEILLDDEEEAQFFGHEWIEGVESAM